MIPQPYNLVIPVVASALAAWLKDDRLPPWLNYAIIIIFFSLACVASAFASGLTGDPSKDIYIVVGVCAAVFAVLQTAMNQVSGAITSPLVALATNNAKRAEYQKEFEAWMAEQANTTKSASVPPQPPEGGSVFAPPTNPPEEPSK